MPEITRSHRDVDTELILPNLGRRFSGVTSTLIQVLSQQISMIPLVVWGNSYIEGDCPTVGFFELLKITKPPLSRNRFRVYHARRNIEMLWGWILKVFFGHRIKLLFTSTAQRRHSRYTRFLIRKMDGIITTSKRAERFLENSADYIVPHGIRTDEYPYERDKSILWEKLNLQGERGIGIFGRIRPQKGIDLFVDAMLETLPQIPGFTAVIVGRTTPKFEAYVLSLKRKIKIKGLEDRFVWLGEVEFKLLPKLYGAMSVVASVSRVEGFGLTCLESMSSGTPVIASRTGGFELVVRDGLDGRLVDCDSSEQIATAFLEMTKEPSLLERMGASSRKRIEDSFTIEREAKALVDIYRKYAESRN
jgi:mannosyltransferase